MLQVDIDRTDLQSKAITPEEANAIITAAKSYSYNQAINDKWSLYFKVLWHTGLRTSEVLALKRVDVLSDHLNIKRLKKRGKDDPSDIIWIKPELYYELITYITTYNIKGRLFPNTRRTAEYIFDQLKHKTGIRVHVTMHGFRHGFAFNFLEQVGRDRNAAETLTSLQRWLGHENITTTMRYTHKGVKDLKIDLGKIKF